MAWIVNITSLLATSLGLVAGYYALRKHIRSSPKIRGKKGDIKIVTIEANLKDGFCGLTNISISRLPHGPFTSFPSAPSILQVIHPSVVDGSKAKKTWDTTSLESDLSIGNVQISRTTLLTLFTITNARPIFKYSSASGHRASYPSYCGIWTIEWPIGKPCTATLSPHDSHTSDLDVYPPTLKVRTDKCIEMLAGIICLQNSKVAFPGRAKDVGPYVLEFRRLGFPGAHGTQHLYNMEGGKVSEIDLLALKTADPSTPIEGCRQLSIRCLDPNYPQAALFVPRKELNILAQSLDHLPWTSLSWSLHRGLKDILLAFGTPIMNTARSQLAVLLKSTVTHLPEKFISLGWNEAFVRGPMPDLVSSSILAGGGNSGDMVRVVVAAAEVFCGDIDASRFDQTLFWQGIVVGGTGSGEVKVELGLGCHDEVIALTKFFVLEWSVELDYQLYHDIPMSLVLA